MPAQIQELIVKYDNSERVRDLIASILAVEIANQQNLAQQAGRDPREWQLKIYKERANPWAEFLDPDTKDQLNNPPIVNVCMERTSITENSSNQIERQKYTGTFNIDCYGLGVSTDEFGGGHVAGDGKASLEAQRAARLVRNILMASQYTYLGNPPAPARFVWRRWVDSITIFQPQLDNREVQHVVAARIAFQVDFNEFSPQYVAETLDILHATVTDAQTGEVLVTAEYDYTSP